MAQLTVWGASDDVIELRCYGDLKVCRDDGEVVASADNTSIDEEFGAWCGGHPYKGRLVVQDAGQAEIAYVHCWYDGTWCFGPGHQHNGNDFEWPFPPAIIGPCSDTSYSTQLTLEMPDGCTVSFDPVE